MRGGQGLFTLPAGLDTTAPAQPMPIFLIDRACAGATHTLDFSVTNPTLRPGILFGAQSDVDYLAVTCERHGLVLARYGRAGREVIAEGPHPGLVAATPYHLRVAVNGGTVHAKVWKASRQEPAVWHLTGRPPGRSTARRG